jgi:hypothetical protein
MLQNLQAEVLQNRSWGILRGFLIDAIAAISTITRIARSWCTRSVARYSAGLT